MGFMSFLFYLRFVIILGNIVVIWLFMVVFCVCVGVMIVMVVFFCFFVFFVSCYCWVWKVFIKIRVVVLCVYFGRKWVCVVILWSRVWDMLCICEGKMRVVIWKRWELIVCVVMGLNSNLFRIRVEDNVKIE